jgi:hypothetical protein
MLHELTHAQPVAACDLDTGVYVPRPGLRQGRETSSQVGSQTSVVQVLPAGNFFCVKCTVITFLRHTVLQLNCQDIPGRTPLLEPNKAHGVLES